MWGDGGTTERKGRQDAKDVSLRATNHPSVHRVLFQPGGGRILTKPSLFAMKIREEGERERERNVNFLYDGGLLVILAVYVITGLLHGRFVRSPREG